MRAVCSAIEMPSFVNLVLSRLGKKKKKIQQIGILGILSHKVFNKRFCNFFFIANLHLVIGQLDVPVKNLAKILTFINTGKREHVMGICNTNAITHRK